MQVTLTEGFWECQAVGDETDCCEGASSYNRGQSCRPVPVGTL